MAAIIAWALLYVCATLLITIMVHAATIRAFRERFGRDLASSYFCFLGAAVGSVLAVVTHPLTLLS